MSDTDSLHADDEERRFALVEALRAARAGGAAVDASALAARFGLPAGEARRALEALALLDGAAEEPPELAPPELPDDYELLDELGRGGMGVVYRARQRSLAREVAVKVLRPGELAFADALRRFRREAQALARLRHPHIVRVHEVGEAGGHLYYTMDLVEGRPLSALIRAGEMTPSRAVRLLRQVAGAIQYSHAHGLIHRDLKPANVLVDDEDQAFVCDFGLARDLAVEADHTASGRVLGTPAYMAPEQARGEAAAIGERTDVYALGAILYECLTGRAPFAGLGLAETVVAVLHQEPTAPRKLAPGVPAALERVALQALEKDPERRYPTARAFLEDLERFESGRPVRAAAPGRARRLGLWLRRERSAVQATAVTLALVALAFWQLVLPRLGARQVDLVGRADALEARGEAAAALALLEETVAGREADDVALAARMAALRIDVADAAGRAGDAARAERLLRRVVDDLGPRLARAEDGHAPLARGDRARLRVPYTQALAALGEPEARERWGELGREIHWLDDALELAWRPGAAPLPYGGGIDPTAFTFELALAAEGALVDPRDARHAAALDLWFECLTSMSSHALLAHLATREESAVPAIAALLAGLHRLSDVDRRRAAPDFGDGLGWREALAAQDAPALARAALALAADPGAPEVDRDAAFALACDAIDLPWRDGRSEAYEDRDALVAFLSSLPLEDREATVDAVARRALGWLVAAEAAADHVLPARIVRWADVALGAGAWGGARGVLERLGPGLAGAEPFARETLRAAVEVDLQTAADPARLLPLFERAERGVGAHRHKLHMLLALVVPAGTRAPSWPARIDEEPANLVALWRRALGVAEDVPRFARVALVVVDAQDGGARLERSLAADVAPGAALELQLVHEVAEPWGGHRPGGPLALGWPLDEARARSVEVRLRGRLAYRPEGLLLAWDRAELGATHAERRGVSPRTVSPRAAAGEGRATLAARLQEVRFLERQPRAWVLVLSRLERGRAAEASAWTLADWERALLEELAADVRAGRAVEAPALEERLELCSWLAPAGLAEALAGLSLSRSCRRAQDLAARAMGGDGAFFERPAAAARFRRHLQADGADASWWRLALARPAARAALDPEALEHGQRLVRALTEEDGRRAVRASRGTGVVLLLMLVFLYLPLAAGAVLLLCSLRFPSERVRSLTEGVFSVLAIAAPFGWFERAFGGGPDALRFVALASTVLAAGALARVTGLLTARALFGLLAAALGVAAAALLGGARGTLLPVAGVLAALGLLALAALGVALPPRPEGHRRRLQLAATAVFALVVVAPLLADAAALLAERLGAPGLAAHLPFAGDGRDPGAGQHMVTAAILWCLWVRNLAHPPRARRARAAARS